MEASPWDCKPILVSWRQSSRCAALMPCLLLASAAAGPHGRADSRFSRLLSTQRTMQLKIKQVTGAETFPVTVEPSATIAELKQTVADILGGDTTPETLRLIYRGQILKDPLTVESYGKCFVPLGLG